MSTFPRSLVRAFLSTLGGLPLGCAAVAALSGLYIQVTGPEPFSSISPGWAAGGLVSFFALVYGAIPALLVGAPLYALLLHRGWATYLSAVLVGILPGLALLPIEQGLAYFFLAYGAPVAAATHFTASRLGGSRFVAAR